MFKALGKCIIFKGQDTISVLLLIYIKVGAKTTDSNEIQYENENLQFFIMRFVILTDVRLPHLSNHHY